jgi:hypothetical protein
MFDFLGFAAIVLLAGAFLPSFLGLRLLAAALIGVGLVEVWERDFYSPGIGDTFGLMIVATILVLLTVGVMARAAYRAARVGSMALPPPDWIRTLDRLLVIAAMGIPAGLTAMALGGLWAGSGYPVALHSSLLAGLAVSILAVWWWMDGHPRAAAIAFCTILGAITIDSLFLERQLRAEVLMFYADQPHCLSIGPTALSLDAASPLMGLTAPKPILLLVNGPSRPEVLRWSFRGHLFVGGGAPPRDVRCTPTLP